MINVPENKVPESFFDSIDEEHVMKAAMNIKGSAWPSGRMDSELYRRVICSRSFKRAGKALRERIILFAKNIGRKFYDQQLLEAYTASRLIPLGQKILDAGLLVLEKSCAVLLGKSSESQHQLKSKRLRARCKLVLDLVQGPRQLFMQWLKYLKKMQPMVYY